MSMLREFSLSLAICFISSLKVAGTERVTEIGTRADSDSDASINERANSRKKTKHLRVKAPKPTSTLTTPGSEASPYSEEEGSSVTASPYASPRTHYLLHPTQPKNTGFPDTSSTTKNHSRNSFREMKKEHDRLKEAQKKAEARKNSSNSLGNLQPPHQYLTQPLPQYIPHQTSYYTTPSTPHPNNKLLAIIYITVVLACFVSIFTNLYGLYSKTTPSFIRTFPRYR